MFEKFFASFQESVIQTTCIVTIVVCFALIISDILLFAIKFNSRKSVNSILCIVFSTVLGVLFSFPIPAAFDKLISVSKYKNNQDQLLLDLENGNLDIENHKLKIEINQLNQELNNLRCSQISAMQFEKIAELALLKTDLKQTSVYTEKLGGINKGMGVRANYYYDQVLLVMNHEIEAKFGVDINEIRIKKLEDGKISVSGIKPIFIGASKNITENPISEIRTVNLDNDENIKSINVKNDIGSVQTANKIAQKKNKEYQSSLKDMENFKFLEDAVVTLAHNFISIIFAPVYGDNIVFDENDYENGQLIEDFIKSEIDGKTKLLEEKLSFIR